jgi:putative ABC transport system permease protein
MLAHYLAFALARLMRAPFAAAANVLTLALGLACFIAAYGIATYWRSGDAHHPGAERIYYIGQTWLGGEEAIESSVALPDALREELPTLEAVAQIYGAERNTVAEGPITTEDGAEAFLQTATADPGLFDMFALEFVEGEPTTALRAPNEVVLTEPAARRLFGDSPALGQTLTAGGNQDLTVTGVIAPVRQPSFMGHTTDSPVSFDMLRGRQTARAFDLEGNERSGPIWGAFGGTTIVRLPPGMPVEALEARLDDLGVRATALSGFEMKFFVRPIADLTTRLVNQRFLSQMDPGLSASAILLALGAVILLVACVNYANLAAAQAESRTKESGMRKVLGAARVELFAQHMLESGLLTIPALALAVLTVAAASPVFLNILGVEVTHFLARGPEAVAFLAAVTLASAVAAGLYPALSVMRVRASHALGADASRTGTGALARLLVGVQFLSASFLVIIVTVTQLQQAHLRDVVNKPDPVVVVASGIPGVGDRPQLGGADAFSSRPHAAAFEAFASELLAEPQVRGVTATDRIPWDDGGISMTGIAGSGEAGATLFTAESRRLGREWAETMGVEVLAGRALDPERDRSAAPIVFGRWPEPAATPTPAMIDLRLAQALGYADPRSAIGRTLHAPSPQDPTGPRTLSFEVVGVVETDPTRLIAQPPTWASGATAQGGTPGRIAGVLYVQELTLEASFANWYPAVRIDRNDIQGGLAAIERVWRELEPDRPVRLLFTDDLFEEAYAPFSKIGMAFVVLSLCALIISTTGLLGIAVHVAARRRREMGIRKTLGASALGLARLLLVDFSRPVLVANLLAWPLGYLAAQAFLQPFAERIALTPAPFAFSLGLTLLIAWAAVIGEVLKAASVRPAEVLRHA